MRSYRSTYPRCLYFVACIYTYETCRLILKQMPSGVSIGLACSQPLVITGNVVSTMSILRRGIAFPHASSPLNLKQAVFLVISPPTKCWYMPVRGICCRCMAVLHVTTQQYPTSKVRYVCPTTSHRAEKSKEVWLIKPLSMTVLWSFLVYVVMSWRSEQGTLPPLPCLFPPDRAHTVSLRKVHDRTNDIPDTWYPQH